MVWDGLDRSPIWAAFAEGAAEAAGFHRVEWPLESGSFGLGGEVSPHVAIRFQRVTDTNVAPEVVVGVYSEAFEREWGDRLRRTSLRLDVGEAPPFSLLALNIDGLVPRPWTPRSPSDEDVAELKDYLDRSFEYAKRRLPSNIDSLVAAIEADKIGDHPVWFYLGHPVKVRGFVQWLRRTHGVDVGDRLLSGLDDETEPYDVKVMLDAPD
jgi:hypothetical protein